MSFIGLLLALIPAAVAQPATLSLVPSAATVRPGGTITLRVVYTASPTVAAALGWTLPLPSGFTMTVASSVPASAGKTLYADSATPIALLAAMNTNIIPAGDVAVYTVTVPQSQGKGPVTFTLSGTLGATATVPAAPALATPVTAGPSVSVNVLSRFDLNGDGVTDGIDFMTVVSQIRGLTICGPADFNADSKCDPVDGMLFVLGALGLIQ